MSPRQIDVHPEAVAEARAAAQWYRERSALAADAFLAELDRAVERITENPERHATLSPTALPFLFGISRSFRKT